MAVRLREADPDRVPVLRRLDARRDHHGPGRGSVHLQREPRVRRERRVRDQPDHQASRLRRVEADVPQRRGGEPPRGGPEEPQAPPRCGRPRDHLPVPRPERVVGGGRRDPVRGQVRVRQADLRPDAGVPAAAELRLRDGGKEPVLLRSVRILPPAEDPVLPRRVGLVRDPGHGRRHRPPPRVPELVGLRVRGGGPGEAPDGRGQLPERVPPGRERDLRTERERGDRPPEPPAHRGGFLEPRPEPVPGGPRGPHRLRDRSERGRDRVPGAREPDPDGEGEPDPLRILRPEHAAHERPVHLHR